MIPFLKGKWLSLSHYCDFFGVMLMIQKMKKYLLHLMCVVAVLLGMTGCEGPNIGSGSGDDPSKEDVIELRRCWALKSFCGVEADADICINFAKDGKFTIYQRTEELEYTVFDGTYTVDEENSLVSGIYSDGSSWVSSYHYTVDVEARELLLESVENPAEVAVYEPATVPTSALLNTRSASVADVKPL